MLWESLMIYTSNKVQLIVGHPNYKSKLMIKIMLKLYENQLKI